MEQSKRASLSVARSILNHKLIGKKLESYLKVCLCCLVPNNAMEIIYVLNLLVQLSLYLQKNVLNECRNNVKKLITASFFSLVNFI